MNELLETCFTGPILPASVLLVLVTMYWALVVVGLAGLELFDLDVDVDADLGGDGAFESVMSAGAATLRFLNIGRMPLNIWLSVFAISFWTISIFLDRAEDHESLGIAAAIAVRNTGLALIAAKILTQPLRGKFDPVEPARPDELIGLTGEVATAEASQTSGQGRFAGQASQLLLNVRTAQGVLPKGAPVEIVDYDAERGVYLIAKFNQKDKQEVNA